MLIHFQLYYPVYFLFIAVIVCFLLYSCLEYIHSILGLQRSLLNELIIIKENTTKDSTEIRELISEISNTQTRNATDLHTLAAHFVPRIRTKTDIHDEYYFQESLGFGYDLESDYINELINKPK